MRGAIHYTGVIADYACLGHAYANIACDLCGNVAVPDWTVLGMVHGAEYPIGRLMKRLRCSRCGKQAVRFLMVPMTIQYGYRARA